MGRIWLEYSFSKLVEWGKFVGYMIEGNMLGMIWRSNVFGVDVLWGVGFKIFCFWVFLVSRSDLRCGYMNEVIYFCLSFIVCY